MFIIASVSSLFLLILSSPVVAQTKAIDYVLLQNDELKIVPNDHGPLVGWCSLVIKNRFPKVLFLRVEHKRSPHERAQLFKPNFEEFVLQQIIPTIDKACSGTPGFLENYNLRLSMQDWSDSFGYYDFDNFVFRYRNGTVTRTQYNPSSKARSILGEKGIEALRPPKQLDRVDKVLGKIGPFTLYPNNDPFCYGAIAHVDAVFDSTLDERDKWVRANYKGNDKIGFEGFVSKEVLPRVQQHCKRFMAVELHLFERDSVTQWESMRFDFGYRGSVSIAQHNMSEKAKSYARLKINERVFGTCDTSPYCAMLGGVYLDAIYRNDTVTIARINKQLEAEYARKAGTADLQRFFNIIAEAGVTGADNVSVSLGLPTLLTTKYIYDYSQYAVSMAKLTGNRQDACFREGAKAVDTRTTTRVIDYQDQFGNYAGSAGGIKMGKVYRVNPEFQPLCQSFCGPASGEFADFLDSFFTLEKTGHILAGLEQSIRTMDCQSKDVLQFEKNLIALAERSLQSDAKPSVSSVVQRSDVEKAQDTKRLFEAVMDEQAQSETSQTHSNRTPRTRTGTRQTQSTASHQRETSRFSRLAALPVIDESVLSDLDGNLKVGKKFLSENRNSEGVVETNSGLQYRVIRNGSGRKPTSNDQITAHMSGKLINGHVFSDTYAKDEPLSLPVGQVIKGLGEGLKQINEGGKIQLFIPPSLAYGNQAVGSNIPAGSTLIYEIELIKID